MILEENKMVYIQSYKHDGSLHRTWAKGLVLESNEKQFVVVTNKAWVTESNGRHWITREPAICFFYPDRWFNIVCMIRKTGIYYYCNLASPSLYDSEAIKNIDYDLDVKVYPDGSWDILDRDEYIEHSNKMAYSEDIKEIIEEELKNLIVQIEKREGAFSIDEIERYYKKYDLFFKKQE